MTLGIRNPEAAALARRLSRHDDTAVPEATIAAFTTPLRRQPARRS